jgi:hypothetical protein
MSVATYWCEVTGERAWVLLRTRTHEHKFKEERSCFDFFGHFLAGKLLKLSNRCCSEMEVARILFKRIFNDLVKLWWNL